MDQIADAAEVTDLINRYAWALDTRDFDTLGRCFVDDCEFDSLPREYTRGLGFPACGRTDIVAVVSSAQASWPTIQRRHLVSNVVVDFASAERATVRSYMTVLHTEPGGAPTLVLAGYYEDEVVRGSDGRWLFAKRTVRRDGPTQGWPS